MERGWLILLLIGVAGLSYGQHSYTFGLLPGVNVNKKLGNDWRLNGKIESRVGLTEGVFTEGSKGDLEWQLADVSLLLSRNVGLNNKLAGGYLIRFRAGGEVNHRFIQQFTVVSRYAGFRLAHRLSTDQTFAPNEAMAFRARYRIGTDVALSGQSVDPREFYIKVNNEYLGKWQATDLELEIRLVPTLGFAISDDNKLEWALDYRFTPGLLGTPESNFWAVLNWYRSF